MDGQYSKRYSVLSILAVHRLFYISIRSYKTTEHWRQTVDKKECAAALSTDMSKSFDSLHAALMIAKLEAYGLCLSSLQLMRSFFSERFNRLKLNGKTSSWKHVTIGCPQESFFCPLFWNLFQNDLSYQIKNDSLFMYSDDHHIYTSGKHIHYVKSNLKKETDLASV